MMFVDNNKCIGCSLCIKDCIVSDIKLVDGKAQMENIACIKCGHCIAICPKEAVSMDTYDMNEVKEYNKEDFDIDADNLLNFIKFRRSTRHFKNKEVENEKIEKIIEAGRFTQTGSNMQNVSYVVVKENLQELRKIVLETLNTQGIEIINNPAMPDQYKRYANMWIKMYNDFIENPNREDKLFFKAPTVILTVSPSEVNASLAASNMELMVNALGLGTFFSGFLMRAATTNPLIPKMLGLSEEDKLVNCMVIGYPSVNYKRTVPREKANISWK